MNSNSELNYSNNSTQQSVLNQAAALADSNLFADYLVYENQGECWYAGGIQRAITVYANYIEVKIGETVKSISVAPQDLAQALHEQLKQWQGNWQVCGWACFEFAYALHTPELLKHGELDEKEPLLFLCEPELSVTLRDNHYEIKTTNNALQKQAQAILNNVTLASTLNYQPVTVTDDPRYRDAVRKSVIAINNNELEKVILSRKVPLHFTPDLTATWLYGLQNNTPARSFTMQLKNWKATGFSPEIVMALDKHGMLTTQPLAGTRRLEGDMEQDKLIFDELLKDPKETHEHAISVRLSMDEMEQVCTPSTVHVDEFMTRKLRGSVQHLASKVRGQLKPNYNAWHAFTSLFPAVTASGIPKAPAFAQICSHELSNRGLYSGAIFKLNSEGEMDAALVLRSVLSHGDNYWLQAGAGIVKDSTPSREHTETTEKMNSISPWVVAKR
ncbi:Salicylate synthase [Pseudoalteromonas holothuriae]|uniref:Salicylate synthase n=1 Tax=Pseudoalteromonas holothuriae TaxID=2963714 RepID=A0A9W4QSE6_9GAMM|nr:MULTISPECIES: salicylate synthase [unclassified Pseudoalteromonas]CAH9051196.1 Salicylate synthase [Pseudoalteromonas sp. CIP111854]CAH9056684.1 Salicylate synthase [Pseudoalteromonas sp. CIP111951]